MRTPFTAVALGLAISMLVACDRKPSTPPAPTVSLVPIESRSPASGTPDPSLPPADTVVTPAAQAKPDAAGGRTNRSMSGFQESTAMPMPGQNNDHSAPLAPPRPASGATSPPRVGS